MAVTMQIGVQQNFGKAGCSFAAESAIQLAGNANQLVSRGLWMVALSANDKVQYTPDSGTTFRDFIPAGAGGIFYSDGFNVRILNTGVADAGAVKTFLSQILDVPGI